MVRAAASGAFDYAHADPYNPQWRLRHSLILREVARREDIQLILALQQHWLAYVSHSRLEDDSWNNAKNSAAHILTHLRSAIYPWDVAQTDEQKSDTINNKYADLIAKYRELIGSKTQNNKE
jgi:hypothetical protein